VFTAADLTVGARCQVSGVRKDGIRDGVRGWELQMADSKFKNRISPESEVREAAMRGWGHGIRDTRVAHSSK